MGFWVLWVGEICRSIVHISNTRVFELLSYRDSSLNVGVTLGWLSWPALKENDYEMCTCGSKFVLVFFSVCLWISEVSTSSHVAFVVVWGLLDFIVNRVYFSVYSYNFSTSFTYMSFCIVILFKVCKENLYDNKSCKRNYTGIKIRKSN